MTKRHLMTLRLVLLLGDGVAAWLVFLVVSRLRFDADPTARWSVAIGVEIGTAAILFAVTWVTILWAMGLYRLRVRWSLWAEARDLAKATTMALAITLSMLFLTHQDDVSRVFLAALFIAQPAVSLAERGIVRYWFDLQRRRGRNTSYMLVVGTGDLAEEFASRVEAHRELGLRVIGHLTVPPGEGESARTSDGAGDGDERKVSRPVLGSVDNLPEIFRKMPVDEVAICLPPTAAHLLDPVVSLAAEEGKTVRIPSDPREGLLGHVLTEDFDGFLVRSVIHDSHRDLELALKRVLDVIGALTALILLSPILIVTAVAIWRADGSPVLFRQTRIGRHGRPFTIYKFRTMAHDAEARFREVSALSDTQGAAFKMRDDPRVTRLGRFLRSSSIDELPQLINVLRGEMSLVGPRPAPAREVDHYDVWHRRRLSMRPGMTGLWQITARLDDHFDNRAELDLQYIDRWTFWMDIAILAKTMPALIALRGR